MSEQRMTTKEILESIENKDGFLGDVSVECLNSRFWAFLKENMFCNFHNYIYLYNSKTDDFETRCFTGNTYFSFDDHLTVVFSVDNNYFGNFYTDQPNDMVTDEEWKEMQEKFSEDADWMNESQLSEIGVDFNERFVELLRYLDENN
jgi:hypothetical protein